jgi:MinD-like ATPase involved in chromosome partitioning or flagellar assembly/DNA-binding NarL/FixJ family response regulator
MDQQQAGRAIRVVVAAPFAEIVSIHERVAEYADELDVCGVVSSAAAVAEQAGILKPEVVVLSENLGIDPADAAAQLSASAPTTKLVVLASSRDTLPPGAADAVVRLDASAGELRAAIMLAAGRLRSQTAPPAHSRAWSSSSEPSRWFWEEGEEPAGAQPEPSAEPGAPGEPPAAAETPAPAAKEASDWPPSWLRIASDTEEAEQPDLPAPPASPPTRLRGRAKRPAAEAPDQADESPPVEPEAAAPLPEAEAAAADTPTADADPGAPDPESAEPAHATVLTLEFPAVAEPVIDAVAEPEPEPEEEPLIEQPRRRVRRPGRTKADTVLVFSGKGGVGKSVLATNLAVALSQRGSKVALIDLNLQYGDVGVLLHVESHPTSIESLAQQGEQVDRDYLDEVMATGPEDVRILLAPASPEFADLVTAASIRAILRELSRGYDYIIVDTPAHIEERVLEVIEVADQILVVSSFNITSVKDTKVTLKLLQSLGIERDRIAVVLNQTHAKVGFPREEIEKSVRREILAHLPYDPRIDESIDTGRPTAISEPRSEFNKQLRVVVDFLTPEEATAEPSAGAQARDRASKRRLFGR